MCCGLLPVHKFSPLCLVSIALSFFFFLFFFFFSFLFAVAGGRTEARLGLVVADDGRGVLARHAVDDVAVPHGLGLHARHETTNVGPAPVDKGVDKNMNG